MHSLPAFIRLFTVCPSALFRSDYHYNEKGSPADSQHGKPQGKMGVIAGLRRAGLRGRPAAIHIKRAAVGRKGKALAIGRSGAFFCAAVRRNGIDIGGRFFC